MQWFWQSKEGRFLSSRDCSLIGPSHRKSIRPEFTGECGSIIDSASIRQIDTEEASTRCGNGERPSRVAPISSVVAQNDFKEAQTAPSLYKGGTSAQGLTIAN